MGSEHARGRREALAVVAIVALVAGVLSLTGGGPAAAATDSITTVGANVYTVPAGVTSIQFELLGADGFRRAFATTPNSRGGKVVATLAVTPGEKLQINVGGKGTQDTSGSA